MFKKKDPGPSCNVIKEQGLPMHFTLIDAIGLSQNICRLEQTEQKKAQNDGE